MFALAGNAAAATSSVSNCNPAGQGSLRDVVFRAGDGDTIDLTRAQCTRIQLAGKPITISQNNLRILGPGRNRMVIDGNDKSLVLLHSGNGTLWISGVSIEHGHNSSLGEAARGGCIYSAGAVRLDNSRVRHCLATSEMSSALGGGINALRSITANHSSVVSNAAIGRTFGEGGGMYSASGTLNYSQIVGNEASTTSGSGTSYGGGIRFYDLAMNYSMLKGNRSAHTGGGAYIGGIGKIDSSTITGNRADYRMGGIGGDAIDVVNSTISGNHAPRAPALGGFDLRITYSTIAFNNSFSMGCTQQSAAVRKELAYGDLAVYSSILAHNTCEGSPGDDVWSQDGSISGESSVIMSSAMSLPEDTIRANPMLQPLAANGGIGLTHALEAGSPAIDAGANFFTEVPAWDQRGPGYPRTKGVEPDIGAYEY